MTSTVSALEIPLTALQQYLQDRSRDSSDTRERLHSPDYDYGFEESTSPPSIETELYYHCVDLRKNCIFEDDLGRDGSGLSLIRDQAQRHVEIKGFLDSDIYKIWNTPLSKPWYNDHPPCLCFGSERTEICEVCYQIKTKLKRPWYIVDNSYHLVKDRVCEVCYHIDWPLILRPQWREVYGDNDLRIPLGTLSDLQKRKHCAVCALILAALALNDDSTSAMATADRENIVGVLIEDRIVHDTARLEVEFKVLPYQYNDIRLLHKIKLHEITAEPKPGLGRRVPHERIDVDVLRQWLAKCDSHNVMLPGTESFLPMLETAPSFRLIDVVEERVVESSIRCRFLALSYVWGGYQQFQSTKQNQNFLGQRCSLRDAELPLTIRDAIDLVRETGERYLWVDSLCITQDDDEYKMEQIRLMDQIYNNAVAVIVCATGKNAEAGLIGFRSVSRKWTQYTAAIQGLIVANYAERTDSMEEIWGSKWRSRAWTFQEEMLARRQLTFTSNEVIFESAEGEFSEQFHDLSSRLPHLERSDETDTHFTQSSLQRRFSSGETFEKYTDLISEYSARQMSYSTDALNAIEGVLSYLKSRFPGGFAYGLPYAYLNTALIWDPFGPVKRRRHPTSGAPIFPSWSWAGWECKVSYNNAQESRAKDLLEFIDPRSRGRFSSIDVYGAESASQSKARELDSQGDATLKLPAIAERMDDNSDCTQKDYEYNIPTIMLSEMPKEYFFLGDASQYLTISARQSSLYLVQNRLLRNGLAQDASPTPLIFTPSGHLAGIIYVAPETIPQLPTARYDFLALAECSGQIFEEPSPYWYAHGDSRAERGRVDDAALSIEERIRVIYPGWGVRDLNVPRDVAARQSLFDYGIFEWRERCCLNVMLVEWEGGVAYRLGSGICHADAFEQGGPVKRDIVLG